jgi:hypothetical protein
MSPNKKSIMHLRLGLNISKTHCKVHLYFIKILYKADDEDSDALNQILGWLELRIHKKALIPRTKEEATGELED